MRARRTAVTLSIMLLTAGLTAAQTIWEPDPGIVVLGPGDAGTWDAGGRAAATVLFDGLLYHMWFVGWEEDGDERAIGHATSDDGLDWESGMDPLNPVLTRGGPGSLDESYVFSPVVLYFGGQYHMWYSAWHNNKERVLHATSPDGSVWDKDLVNNPVIDVGPPGSWNDWIVRPGAVILDAGVLKMWYMAADTTPVGRIGYAESLDGIVWNERPFWILVGGGPGAWDLDVFNPSVVFDGDTYHMWYVGGDAPPEQEHRVGYAFSADGIHWTKHRANPVVQTADQYAFLAPVIRDGLTFHMWYSHGYPPFTSISYASSDCCCGIFGDDFEIGDTSLWNITVP